MNFYIDQARGFNYTQIKALYGDEFNLAPRAHLWSDINENDYAIYFIDLEQEKKINVGVDWPYPDMKPGECVLTQDMASEGYEVGQDATFITNSTGLWTATATVYNDFVRIPADPDFAYKDEFVDGDYA